jgi:hypothetical protein
MVPEDEILLCGMALLVGVVLGLAVGLLRARRAGRAA